MGLDNILPDDADSSSSSSGGSKRSPSSDTDDDLKVIGSPPNQKSFTQEKWEGVKKVIYEDTEHSVNEVLNMPAKRRYEILHEAALTHEGQKAAEDMETYSRDRCFICGKDCTNSGVTVAGKTVHANHPVMKLKKALEEDEK